MIAAFAVLALLTPPAAPPPPRPGLNDLAYALGEAHALRQACHGRSDGRWRVRMSGVLDAEHVGRERRTQLVERFNAGFAAARAAHRACDEGARAALSETLARAAPLARSLARP